MARERETRDDDRRRGRDDDGDRGRERQSSRRRDDDGDDFGYHKRSPEATRRRAAERTGNFDSYIKGDFKRYKVRDGKNVIRVLPPPAPDACKDWPDPDSYSYKIHVNYNIGADNQSFLSLSEMKGEKDPLAEAKKEAQRDGDKEMAKSLTPRKRSVMWLIDRLDEEEGPQIWDAPFTVDTDFINLSIDEDTKEITYFDHPKTGNDIRFYKEGSGLATKYPAARMKILDSSPLSSDKGEMQEWLDFIKENPIPDCLQYYDYDHIAGAFDGIIGSRDDDDEKPKGRDRGRSRDDDERPARRGRSRDDDEQDEKPRSRRADPDEEPDEKPARSRSRRDEDEDPPSEKRTGRHRERLDDGEDEGDKKPRRNDDSEGDDDGEGDNNERDGDKPRQSIRDRLNARRSQSRDDD